MPKCCRNKFGSTKERLLAEAHKDVLRDIRLDKLLMTIRILRGVVREKFGIDKAKW